MKMKDARHAKLAADDRKPVVRLTNGKRTPELEVVRLATFVEGMARASVEEDESALRRRHLNWLEVTIEKKYWLREDVCHRQEDNSAVSHVGRIELQFFRHERRARTRRRPDAPPPWP
jgi:hypothetical protein